MRLIFLFLVILCETVQAAESPDIFFKKISTDNGLSHKKVNCILKDSRGFMWFGTEDGLSRYDGRYMVSFKYVHNQKNCISGNIISDMLEDKQGVLWIATQDGGMTKYDYRLSAALQFKQFRNNIHNLNGIPDNGINKIVQDNSGHLWLGTSNNYAVRFNKNTEKFDTPVKEGTKCVLALAMVQHDTLTVGRAGGGLLRINTKTLGYRYDRRYNNLYAKLRHVSVPAIFKDKHENLWLASWDKAVYCIDANGTREKLFSSEFQKAGIPKDDYVSFAEDNYGQIWMAGKKTGVTIYNPDTRKITSLTHDEQRKGSLTDDHVNIIYRDRKGIIWIGTDNGISVFNPLFKPFVQHMLPNQGKNIAIYDFYKSETGDLLIGTSDGLYIQRNGIKMLEHKDVKYQGQSLAISKFFMDVDKQLYIGTDYTLFKYDLKNNVANPLPNSNLDPVMKKLVDSRIVSIVRDTLNSHPVLLVSPYGHFITYYDFITKRWVSREDSVLKIVKRYNIRDNLIRKLYKDKQNNLWIATFRMGLGQWGFTDKDIKYYINDIDNKYSVSNNNVFDIKEDFVGNLWISTYGGGVDYFSRKKKKFFHLFESSNLTEGLQLDKENNLWMLCNGHVHMYDPSIKVYSCYDIPRLDNTGGLSGYIYKDDDDNFYAAGVNYYVTFNPDHVDRIDYRPEIYFTDFKVFNRSYNEYLQRQTIELKYDQNQIAIEYSAPEYSGDNLQYSYKLEGADPDWIAANKRNFVEYANLKGGNYQFKVRATNWKGIFTEKVSTINIVITPPFWHKSWFYVAVFLTISGIVFLIYRYRVNELLQQQAIRNGIAQDLHDQIGSTLSSISVYSEVAKKYYEQGERKQMDYVLDTISTTANEMVSEMADIVWAINPKNDHLASVLQRIQNYAQPLCNIKEVNFVFEYDSSLATYNIGMQNRKNLFLILKEAINNALKHSDCSNLIVRMTQHNDTVELIVEDDGCGFEMENLCSGDNTSFLGNGLSNIKSRVMDLKAEIDFRSEKGLGTFLHISFKRN